MSRLLLLIALCATLAWAQPCGTYNGCNACIAVGCEWDPTSTRCVAGGTDSDNIRTSTDCLCYTQYKRCDSCVEGLAASCYWCGSSLGGCRSSMINSNCKTLGFCDNTASQLAAWIIAVIVISVIVAIAIPIIILAVCCCCIAAASSSSSHHHHGEIHSHTTTVAYTAMPEQPVYVASPQPQYYAPAPPGYAAQPYGQAAPAQPYGQPYPQPKYV